jgi:NADH:ubiquinone oxidoreductase subunit 6 (subunit J)
MKIEKLSRILEILLLAVAVVVAVVFFVGGKIEGTKEPVYTDLLLNTTFVLVFISLVVTFVLSLVNFIKKLIHEPQKSLKSLFGPLCIIVIVLISYKFADSTPLNIPGYDGKGNQGGWLVMADVCLFTTYIMVVATALATVVTGIVKAVR